MTIFFRGCFYKGICEVSGFLYILVVHVQVGEKGFLLFGS